MNELTIEDKVKIKKLLKVSAMLIFLSIAFLFGKYLLRECIAEGRTAIHEKAILQNRLTDFESDIERLDIAVKNSGKELSSLETDENKYINLAGELSRQYDVKLNRFEISPVKKDEKNKKIGTLSTALELEGSLLNIKSFVSEFCKDENTNTVNTFSLRQGEDFIWLNRQIDKDVIFDWFVSEDMLQAAEPAADESVNPNPLSVNTLFSPKPMRCYLEIDFIGLN